MRVRYRNSVICTNFRETRSSKLQGYGNGYVVLGISNKNQLRGEGSRVSRTNRSRSLIPPRQKRDRDDLREGKKALGGGACREEAGPGAKQRGTGATRAERSDVRTVLADRPPRKQLTATPSRKRFRRQCARSDTLHDHLVMYFNYPPLFSKYMQ